jgi:SAM-dependent methyltransferase
MKDSVSNILRDHYKKTFLKHGSTSKGVDWGDKEWAVALRQNNMLEVIRDNEPASILDVGCGYGALADLINQKKLNLKYSGVDVVDDMVLEAKSRHPEANFVCGDFLSLDMRKFDYVVCNGILTQKMGVSNIDMNRFAQNLIKKMFHSAKIGIAFNMMSTHVNFQKDNLFYKNPTELIAWCMSELTPHLVLNSAYELWYEYTVYLYNPIHPSGSL